MRDERIHVSRFDDLCGAGESLVGVAVRAELRRVGALPELIRLGLESDGALRRRRVIRPRDLELLPRRLRQPPAVGHDGNTADQFLQVGAAFDDERVLHARKLLDVIDVRRRHLRTEHRRLFVHGVEHSGQREVDAEHRLAHRDRSRVETLLLRPDDSVVLRILQLHRRQHRHRHLRGIGSKLAVTRGAIARAVRHATRARRQFAGRNAPLLRGRGQDHLTAGSADLTERIPVHRRRETAACELRAELAAVDRSLLDLHAAPIDVELVGDDHREHVLHALPDLRVLVHDGHGAVGGDLDERQGIERRGRRALCQQFRRVEMQRQHHAATGDGADTQE